MNAQAFSELIKNPALLGKYSLWELQELAQEHPYSSVVYSLVALKAHRDGDSNYEHHLNQAALRIADRKKLFELIHSDFDSAPAEPVLPPVEKSLSFDDDFETITPDVSPAETQNFPFSAEEIPPQETELEEPAPAEAPKEIAPQEEAVEFAPEQHVEKTESITEEAESIAEETESITEELRLETPPSTPNPPPSIDLPGADEALEALDGFRISRQKINVEDVENVDSSGALPEEKQAHPQQPLAQQSDAHSFSEWLLLVNKGSGALAPAEQKEEEMPPSVEAAAPEPAAEEPEPLPVATDEEKDIDEIIITKQAKASLAQDDELVTETLAKIYELQKKYDKAIKAYQTLSLKYPDKMAYFADKIEKLKNK